MSANESMLQPPPDQGVSPPRPSHYDTAANLWIHLDQARHTTLYNYLMASTILLLAWATIFTTDSCKVNRHFLLVTFSIAGLLLSIVWFAYGHRANQYVHKAEETARSFEGNNGPFAFREKTRKELSFPGSAASTTYVIPGVPILFCLLYAALVYASL